MILVCRECGQGDWAWSWKISQKYCEICKRLTIWITDFNYKKLIEKKGGSKNAATNK